jgi:hypothetical protein
MIINQEINLADIFSFGKKYNYVRPEQCPRCASPKILGHGYVSRYFDGYDFCLYLKRWICADCGCVISIRPLNYFARHHCIISTIFSTLDHRISTGFWSRDSGITRQRGGHWLRWLKINITIFLGNELVGKLIKAFQQLITLGQCPVFRTA